MGAAKPWLSLSGHPHSPVLQQGTRAGRKEPPVNTEVAQAGSGRPKQPLPCPGRPERYPWIPRPLWLGDVQTGGPLSPHHLPFLSPSCPGLSRQRGSPHPGTRGAGAEAAPPGQEPPQSCPRPTCPPHRPHQATSAHSGAQRCPLSHVPSQQGQKPWDPDCTYWNSTGTGETAPAQGTRAAPGLCGHLWRWDTPDPRLLVRGPGVPPLPAPSRRPVGQHVYRGHSYPTLEPGLCPPGPQARTHPSPSHLPCFPARRPGCPPLPCSEPAPSPSTGLRGPDRPS